MVGGTVIETMVVGDRVWIDCKEHPRRSTTCAIYVDNTAEARSVSEGDMIWWQGGYAYWTAKNRNGKTVGKVEVKLKRRGYSGVNRPEPVQA